MDTAVTERLGTAHPLARHLGDFLTDLGNANASAHTIRAYRGDLLQFAAHHDGAIGELSAAPVRAYLAEIAGLAPATRKRKRAPQSPRSAAGLSATTCSRRTRWTRSTPSRSPGHCPARPRPPTSTRCSP